MAAWRILGSVALVLAMARTAEAQTYPLVETPKAGDCFRIYHEMTLSGEIRVTREGKVVPLKLAATATHDFPERFLMVGPGGLPQKSARFYETAKAVITVGEDRSERTLRSQRQLLVAQRDKDKGLLYSPVGPLTREELELTGEHFDTLALTGLLPGRAVSLGETWKVANAVAQALCNFEGLTTQTLTCKLESVKDNVATVSVAGSASGIDTGALSKQTITASYCFDLARHQLTSLEWKQKDERDQGPASPASSVTATTRLTRASIEQPKCLDDFALISVPDDAPSAALVQLSYRDAKGRFAMVYDRQWQAVSETDAHLVLRLMDRGDFVAQVTITPWTPAEAGKHPDPEAFADAMADTPGWNQDSILKKEEVQLENGLWGFGISAVGQMDGMKVVQNFYLITSPAGEQMVLAFVMTEAQATKLGTRDLSLVRGITFKPREP
jgi:hypothetical protein